MSRAHHAVQVVAVEVLSLFLRERNIKEPAASKYNRLGFLTWIYKTLLLQHSLGSPEPGATPLVPTGSVRADPRNGGAPS